MQILWLRSGIEGHVADPKVEVVREFIGCGLYRTHVVTPHGALASDVQRGVILCDEDASKGGAFFRGAISVGVVVFVYFCVEDADVPVTQRSRAAMEFAQRQSACGVCSGTTCRRSRHVGDHGCVV